MLSRSMPTSWSANATLAAGFVIELTTRLEFANPRDLWETQSMQAQQYYVSFPARECRVVVHCEGCY